MCMIFVYPVQFLCITELQEPLTLIPKCISMLVWDTVLDKIQVVPIDSWALARFLQRMEQVHQNEE